MSHARATESNTDDAPKPFRPPVVVIEDDETIAFALKYMLETEGFKAVVLRDGRAAEDLVARLGPPRLVILDMKLPYVDGIRIVATMRAKPGWARVPIVVLSSISEERAIQRALEAGATEYLVKPFATEQLLARVRQLTLRAS